jgi:hypothetical protein
MIMIEDEASSGRGKGPASSLAHGTPGHHCCIHHKGTEDMEVHGGFPRQEGTLDPDNTNNLMVAPLPDASQPPLWFSVPSVPLW